MRPLAFLTRRTGCGAQTESAVEQKWTACREACTAETVPADKYAEASICLITVLTLALTLTLALALALAPTTCLSTLRLRSVQTSAVCVHACTNGGVRRHRQVFDVIGAAMKIPKDDMMGNATATPTPPTWLALALALALTLALALALTLTLTLTLQLAGAGHACGRLPREPHTHTARSRREAAVGGTLQRRPMRGGAGVYSV